MSDGPKPWRWGAVLLGALLGAGCGSLGETERPRPPAGITYSPHPTVVSQLAYHGPLNADVTVSFALNDPAGDPASVALEVTTDGGAHWRTARVIAGATSGLVTDGSTHQLHWNSQLDLGFHATTAQIRLVPTDTVGRGTMQMLGVAVPWADNLAAASKRVDHWLVHYGTWNDQNITIAQAHQLVVLHPKNADITPAQVRAIQQGVDPLDPADDVIVLGYISVGEDLRTATLTDEQLRTDPHYVGNGLGPVVDPRGTSASGTAIDVAAVQSNPNGVTSPRRKAGEQYASYYVDDNEYLLNPNVNDDRAGRPDRNTLFGGAFVNVGDPSWFMVLEQMTMDGVDKLAGLREIMQTDAGRGLACDGVFLDTIDTCAPNIYTSGVYTPNPTPGQTLENVSQSEWTAFGMRSLIRNIRSAHAGKVVLQNRGIFFYDPRQYQYPLRPQGADHVDFVLFESYRLNSLHEVGDARNPDPVYFPDNRYTYMPKLMAEANRTDGFRVLSLGYAERTDIDKNTLLGTSTTGMSWLLDDIAIAEREAGFRHYLTDGSVTLVNRFELDHADLVDDQPPVWNSTYNDHALTAQPPSQMRVGIQEVVQAVDGALQPIPHAVTVRWDVATDLNRVHYRLYTQTGAPGIPPTDLTNAVAQELVPEMGDRYAVMSGTSYDGLAPTTYPYQSTVTGLSGGTTYWFCIRAYDEAPISNEDTNLVFKSLTVPSPAAPMVPQ